MSRRTFHGKALSAQLVMRITDVVDQRDRESGAGIAPHGGSRRRREEMQDKEGMGMPDAIILPVTIIVTIKLRISVGPAGVTCEPSDGGMT